MTLLGTFIVLALVWIWKHPGAILRVFILVGFATVAGVVVVRDRRHGLPTPWAKLAVLAGAWELHRSPSTAPKLRAPGGHGRLCPLSGDWRGSRTESLRGEASRRLISRGGRQVRRWYRPDALGGSLMGRADSGYHPSIGSLGQNLSLVTPL